MAEHGWSWSIKRLKNGSLLRIVIIGHQQVLNIDSGYHWWINSLSLMIIGHRRIVEYHCFSSMINHDWEFTMFTGDKNQASKHEWHHSPVRSRWCHHGRWRHDLFKKMTRQKWLPHHWPAQPHEPLSRYCSTAQWFPNEFQVLIVITPSCIGASPWWKIHQNWWSS